MSETLPSVPKRRSKALFITLAALAGLALTLWYGWKRPVEEIATRAIREALPRDVEVSKVEVNSPTSISLVGVERGPASAEEIIVTFSPVSALREGVASGVERVEIVRPTIRIEPAGPGERLAPPQVVERVTQDLRGLVAAEAAGLGTPSLSGATIVITDGRLLVGEEEVVSGVRALVTPGTSGTSVQLNAALLHFGDAPWALRGEYRPRPAETGRSVHGLRLSGTRGGASLVLSGEIGDEPEISVEVKGVEAAEIGRLLLPEIDAPQVLESLAAFGAAEGSITLRGNFDRPEVRGQFSGVAGPELGARQGAPWILEVSGGGGLPFDAVLAVDGDALEVLYAPEEGGSLRLSGEGLPVALVGRLVGLAFGVDVAPEGISGSADIDVSIDGLSEGSPEGTFEARLSEFVYGAIASREGRFAGALRASPGGARFEIAASLAGETAVEVSGSGTWEESGVSGALDVPRAYFGTFSLADGEIRFETRPEGLAVQGRAKAGDGSIELRRGLINDEGFSGEVALNASSAPAVVELLRSLNVTFPGDRSVSGALTGAVEVAARSGGGLSVAGRIESDRVGYRDLDFHDVALAGMWSDGRWEIDSLVLKWDEAELVVSARGEGDRVEGEGVFTEGPAWSPRVRIEFSGGGLLSQEVKINGTGEAGDGGVGIDGAWRPPDGEYEVALDLDGVAIAALVGRFVDGEVKGAAGGHVAFWASEAAWRARADLELSDVAYGGVELQSGEFELDLGTVERAGEPSAVAGCGGCLYGGMRLHGAAAPEGKGEAKPVDLRVEFAGDRGTVSALPLHVRGGRITGAGTLALVDGAWTFDLESEGSGIGVARGGIKGVVDFALRLTGSLQAPAIAGNVTVRDGEFDLLDLTGESLPGGGAAVRARGFDPALDIGIEIKPAVVTAGMLLDGEVEGAVAFKGHASSPELYGEVALVRGDIRYLGSRFDAESGRVRFRGRDMPELELAGTRTVDGVKVTAWVKGPADDLKLYLSSEPPLPQGEILELLGVPASVDLSEGWGELARSLAHLVNAELASQVYWRIGRAMENALGLDRFRIDGSDGGVQLTLGKYVNPDLYLSYSRELGGGESQDIKVEYRLGPFATLTSRWDLEEKGEVGVEVAVPF